MGLFGRSTREVEPEVIDLREAEVAPGAAAPPTGPTWGMPSPCPACGGPGYLDHINPHRRVMDLHCPTCFTAWTIAEAECVS